MHDGEKFMQSKRSMRFDRLRDQILARVWINSTFFEGSDCNLRSGEKCIISILRTVIRRMTKSD